MLKTERPNDLGRSFLMFRRTPITIPAMMRNVAAKSPRCAAIAETRMSARDETAAPILKNINSAAW